jgi:hypothetical protein
VASDLTEAQQAEFVIKDNVGFGDWDWDTLANEWEAAELTAWGLDVAEPPSFEPSTEDDQPRLDQKASTICPSCGHEFAKH